MARTKGKPDRSTLRFTEEQVQLARKRKERTDGPLWGELNVLLYGRPWAPVEERWRLIRSSKQEQYWVSDRGHLAVWREGPARLWDRNGYIQAVINVPGLSRHRPRAVHVLVAKAFCQWKPNDTDVRHLNSNQHDNHANNLMPGTPLENSRDRQNHKLGSVPTTRPPKREIWKLSLEYPGVRISNHGRVTLGWWLAFNTAGHFYLQGKRKGMKKHVNMKIILGETTRYELLHRLVYEAFVGSIPQDAQVRHLNDDPHDNRVENLAIGTPMQNVADRILNGHQRYGEDHPNAKYTNEQRRRFLELVHAGETTRMSADVAGIKIYSAYQLLRRLRKGLPVAT